MVLQRIDKKAAMSRSAFAERFTQMVNLSPIQYLSRWRMAQAHELFRSTDRSVEQVAELSGYGSQASFAKVFKKQFGYGPGKARKTNFALKTIHYNQIFWLR